VSNTIGFSVGTVHKSKRFYLAALAPLRARLLAMGGLGYDWRRERAHLMGSHGPAQPCTWPVVEDRDSSQGFYDAAIPRGLDANGGLGLSAHMLRTITLPCVIDPAGTM